VSPHVDRTLEDRLLPDPDAVLHLRPDAAADRAEGADRLLAQDLALLEGGPGLGLLHQTQVERCESRDAAGRQPRALEKRPPGQTGVGCARHLREQAPFLALSRCRFLSI